MRRRRIPALILLVGALAAADPVERALADWDDDATRAKQAYDLALGRANDKAMKAYQAVAKAAVRAGDTAGALAAWRAVLEINRADPAAREYLTATGGLEAALAAIDQPTDLLGNPIAKAAVTMPADAPTIQIGAATGQEHVLGSLRAGQQVLFQYQSGLWNPHTGPGPLSPDAVAATTAYRLTVVDGAASDTPAVATIPPDTLARPFVFTAPRALARAVLRIHSTAKTGRSGQVAYRVAVLP